MAGVTKRIWGKHVMNRQRRSLQQGEEVNYILVPKKWWWRLTVLTVGLMVPLRFYFLVLNPIRGDRPWYANLISILTTLGVFATVAILFHVRPRDLGSADGSGSASLNLAPGDLVSVHTVKVPDATDATDSE